MDLVDLTEDDPGQSQGDEWEENFDRFRGNPVDHDNREYQVINEGGPLENIENAEMELNKINSQLNSIAQQMQKLVAEQSRLEERKKQLQGGRRVIFSKYHVSPIR